MFLRLQGSLQHQSTEHTWIVFALCSIACITWGYHIQQPSYYVPRHIILPSLYFYGRECKGGVSQTPRFWSSFTICKEYGASIFEDSISGGNKNNSNNKKKKNKNKENNKNNNNTNSKKKFIFYNFYHYCNTKISPHLEAPEENKLNVAANNWRSCR